MKGFKDYLKVNHYHLLFRIDTKIVLISIEFSIFAYVLWKNIWNHQIRNNPYHNWNFEISQENKKTLEIKMINEGLFIYVFYVI